MGTKAEIIQSSGLGSHDNTFIAEQTIHQGLSIADATAMAIEMFRQFFPQLKKEAQEALREMLNDELAKRAPEQVIPPSARVAVPTLQGASVSEEDNVRKLYANLLASAMDNSTAKYAHPAFARIIDQMDHFDALMLKRIAEIGDNIPIATIKITNGLRYYPQAMPRFYGMAFDSLNNNWAVSFSIENLARLQLINIFDGTVKDFDYTQFYTCAFALERYTFFQDNHPDEELKMDVSEHAIQVTDFGRQFIKLCISLEGD